MARLPFDDDATAVVFVGKVSMVGPPARMRILGGSGMALEAGSESLMRVRAKMGAAAFVEAVNSGIETTGIGVVKAVAMVPLGSSNGSFVVVAVGAGWRGLRARKVGKTSSAEPIVS